MKKKILIMGLPGAGKSTLAKALAKELSAVVFNGDEVRRSINPHLGFSHEDRIQQAKTMSFLCDLVIEEGGFAIADFVCPTESTRAAFEADYVVWVNTIEASRYADTNALFEAPEQADYVVTDRFTWRSVKCIALNLLQEFDHEAPCAQMLGRFQPFHAGHKKLFEEMLRRKGQVCIMVRTMPSGPDNPYPFEEVAARIQEALREYEGRYLIMQVPNIAAIYYGRDVGYHIERIELDEETKKISASAIRQQKGAAL